MKQKMHYKDDTIDNDMKKLILIGQNIVSEIDLPVVKNTLCNHIVLMSMRSLSIKVLLHIITTVLENPNNERSKALYNNS